MPRVLYLNPTADLYGASRCLLNIVKYADRSQFQAAVILPSAGPLQVELRQQGTQAFVVPELAVLRKRLLRPGSMVQLAARLVLSAIKIARLAQELHADIIDTNSSVVLSGALAATLLRRPHVWHVREILATKAGLWRWFGPTMLRASRRVVCMSRTTAAQFEPFHPDGRVCVIYDGLDTERIRVTVDRAAARARFGLRDDAVVIGTLGYLNPRKGADVLIEAFAQVRRECPERVQLLIGGEPFPGNEPYAERLRKRLESLDLAQDVIFAGFIDDVSSFFAALDLFAFPAHEPEGFGMAVAEAMVAGIPVVGTRLGGISEIVEHGASGWLVEPGSVDALASALLDLTRDPSARARMGTAAQARARQFDSARGVAQLQSLYLGL